MVNGENQASTDVVAQASRALDDALAELNGSTNLIALGLESRQEVREASQAISAELAVLSNLQDSLSATADAMTETTQGLGGDSSEVRMSCSADSFQGIRFYDGTGFGYLRIKPSKVELLVDEPLEFALDGTKTHTYRVAAKGNDIKLYVDDVLAIDGTGKFGQKTTQRLIEFGDISGKSQGYGSAWSRFRYTVEGNVSPDSQPDSFPREVLSVPGGGLGASSTYSGKVYTSFDPDDDGQSSCIYRYEEGFELQEAATVAITQSNVRAVAIDPNKPQDVFGSSGKYVGTDTGVQYVLGDKLDNVPLHANMSVIPDEEGWDILTSCEGTCHNLSGGILTIDTRNEEGIDYFDYRDPVDSDWADVAGNDDGWTVEATVKVPDDGTSALPIADEGEYFENIAATSAKDVVLAIEFSPLMGPNEIAAAKKIASQLLRQLNRWDRFNVIFYGQFDNRYPVGSPVINNLSRLFSDDMQGADGETVELAVDFLDNLSEAGDANLLPDVWSGMSAALDLDFTSPNKYVVLIGTGFSHRGAFPDPFSDQSYGTPPTDDSQVSYSVIPPATGYSVVDNVSAKNVVGPAAIIYPVGLGPLLDSVGRVVPSDVSTETTKTYNTMWDSLASDSNGKTFRVGSSDDPDETAESLAILLDPTLSSADEAPDGSMTAPFSALQNTDEACSDPLNPRLIDSPPPEDGLNAPGIVINDGKYQEVVQFFQRGIRLKYARMFAPVDLASDFYSVRIVAKGTAIAVYAKKDRETEYNRVLFAPNGLFVGATIKGDVGRPELITDEAGYKHAVWAEAPRRKDEGRWTINYTRTRAENVVSAGIANAPSEEVTNLINVRAGFSLTTSNPPGEGISDATLVSATAEFLSEGVRQGDMLVLDSFMADDGTFVSTPRELYRVKDIISETMVELDGFSSNQSVNVYAKRSGKVWSTAEYSIYRGAESFSGKVQVTSHVLDSVEPSLLAHSSGDIYLAYSNNDAGAYDIFLRRGESGARATSWRETSRLTRGSGLSRNPRMVEFGSEKILVVWQESRLDLLRSQVFYAIVDPQVFQDKVTLYRLSDDSLQAANPAVSKVPHGDVVVVVWEDDLDRTGEAILYKATLSAVTGEVESGPTAITSGGDSRNPSIAHTSIGMLVAYSHTSSGSTSIRVIRLNDDLNDDLNVAEDIPLTRSPGEALRPRILQGPLGYIYVTYDDDRMREGRPDIFVSAYDPKTGLWSSSGQYGMDLRLLPITDHDSYDSPGLAVDPEASGNILSGDVPMLYSVFRASETGSNSELMGSSVEISKEDDNNPFEAILSFEEQSSDDVVYNRAHIYPMLRDDGILRPGVEVATSTVSGTDSSHGFSDLDLGDKRYFELDDQYVALGGSQVKESGALDLWLKPQFASGSGAHVFAGNDSLSNVSSATNENTFVLAQEGSNLKFYVVDENGWLHSTAVSDSDFSWGAGDPLHVRAEWSSHAIGISRINSMCFKNMTTGVACGPDGKIFKTTDGGENWDRVNLGLPITYELYSIDYVSTGLILACGEYGSMLKSTDDGATWALLDTGTTSDLYSVYHDVDSGNSYAVADGGALLKSTDQTSWSVAWDSGLNLYTVSVMSGSSGRVVLVGGADGEDGVIYRSTDDGATFQQATTDPITQVNFISREHYSTGFVTYAVSDDGYVLVTEDSGENWTYVEIQWSGVRPALYSISHVGDPSNTWYAVGSDGTFARGNISEGIENETGLANGAYRTVEARFGAYLYPSTIGAVIAAGSGTSVMKSMDGGIVQTYYTVRSANLNLRINFVEYPQARFSDQPFQWDPSGRDWYVGSNPDGEQSATRFYKAVLSREPALNDTVLRRTDTWTVTTSAGAANATSAALEPLSTIGKRIEWGSLASKSRSHWKQVLAFPCRPVVPLRFYGWTSQFGLAGDLVTDLAFDGSGRLWIATASGIASMNSTDVIQDVSRWESGLGMPENAPGRIINYTNIGSGLTSDYISSISSDESNDVWFGTKFGLGLLQANESSISSTGEDPIGSEMSDETRRGAPRFITDADGLPTSDINVVRTWRNRIFVGTDRGLTVLTKSEDGTTITLDGRNFGESDGLPSRRVRTIFFDDDLGDAYVGTDHGLVRLTLKEGSYFISPPILQDSILSGAAWGDGLLIGTTTGVTFVDEDGEQQQVSSEHVGHSPVLAQQVDGAGKAWLASAEGLVRIDSACDKLLGSTITVNDGLLGNDDVIDFQRYRLVFDPLPGGGCDRFLVYVTVNGERVSSGFEVVPHVPMIVFDEPLRSSDKVKAFVHLGARKVRCLDNEMLSPIALAETSDSRMRLYRKRVIAGSSVVLGGNSAEGKKGFPRMYAVFAVADDPSGAPASSNWPISAASGASASFTRPVQSGTSIYSDSSDALYVVPSVLSGAQLVALPSADEDDKDLTYVTLNVAANCIVYVAYDSRASEIPVWLRSFDAVPGVQRVTGMTTYTSPSGEERLYVATEGTNGCVYGVLDDPSICDITAEIAKDDTGPEGCITSAMLTGTTTMRLNLEARDPVTGVPEMKISPRGDFKDSDGNDLPWIPFSTAYDLEVPLTESTISEEVVTLTSGTFGSFFDWNGSLLATASSPGRVYLVPSGVGQGQPDLLFDTGEEEINALKTLGDLLIVGTGTDGRVFLWDGAGLSTINVPSASRITAFEAFSGLLFIGAQVPDSNGVPRGNVYTTTEADLKAGNEPTLFRSTLETEVTGFAIFAGSLFWTTANEALYASSLEIPSSDIILATTTRRDHRHSFDVPAGYVIMSGLNGTTSTAEGHSHQIINGVVQSAAGHTHVLNGANSGKVFRYDPTSGNVTIEHADDDYRVETIGASTLDSQGLMFCGTHPNGKILRYVPSEFIFIKSFDTMADTVSRIKNVDGIMYAVAGNDFFFFTGTRWEFIGSTGAENVIDIVSSQGSVFLLSDSRILLVRATASTTTSFRASRNACAFATFRDGVGNESDRFDAGGQLKDCYYACISDAGFSGTSGASGVSGVFGVSGASESQGIPAVFHRITEVDQDARAMLSVLGSEPFYSAKKVEKEVGVYDSEILNGTTQFVQWVSMSWSAVTPVGTSVTFQARSAYTREGVLQATWSEEFTGSGYPSTQPVDITSQRGQYLQFRAILRALQQGTQTPELQAVFIQLRTSQAVHFYTVNFTLPDNLSRGILTWNGCKSPPVTDIVFGITGQDSTDFSDYYIIEPNKVFEVPEQDRTPNMRVGIKLVSDAQSVPVVDEFSLMFSLANDAIKRLNLPGMPGSTTTRAPSGPTRTVITDSAQGHTHTITFDSFLDQKIQVNGTTSVNAGHSHEVVSGEVVTAAGHNHDFEF